MYGCTMLNSLLQLTGPACVSDQPIQPYDILKQAVFHLGYPCGLLRKGEQISL